MSKFYRSFLISFTALIAVTVKAQVNVTATTGTTTGTHTTLKSAFDAINAGTYHGIINVVIASSTTETAAAVLNASGTGSSYYISILIKPATGATPIVSGAVASNPLVKILGSGVILDGSNTVGGATQDLTIQNTSTTAPNILMVGSNGTTPISSVTVKNTVLINGVNTGNGLLVTSTTGSAGYFNSINIQNNVVKKSYTGIYALGVTITGNGNGLNISSNKLNSTGADAIKNTGIYVAGVSGATINENLIGGLEGVSQEEDNGIVLGAGTTNTIVSNNTISDILSTVPTTSAFLYYDLSGIKVASGNANANLTISGNLINNIKETGYGASIGISVRGTTAGVVIDKNRIYNLKNTSFTGNVGNYYGLGGATGIYLASKSTVANVRVSNNAISDITGYGYGYTGGFAYDYNGFGIAIDSGAGYGIYNNTVMLATSPTRESSASAAILVGPGVTQAGAINLLNNILHLNMSNTVNKYAVYCSPNPNVFGNMDYNMYSYGAYAAGIYMHDIPAINSVFGGNQWILLDWYPTFVDVANNNLHIDLNNPNNAGFDGKGIPLTSVPSDMDGEMRNLVTPDIGADEFSIVLPVTFVDIQAKRVAKNNLLSWSTATEVNNTGFEVQRSANGKDFSKIDFVKSIAFNGTSNDLLRYDYSDINPLVGTNYYRLKQIDKDNRSMYSKIVSVKGDISNLSIVNIYPNPVKQILNLQVMSSSSGAIEIIISDLAGRLLIRKVTTSVEGLNNFNINVSSLSKGAYFIKVLTNNKATNSQFVKD